MNNKRQEILAGAITFLLWIRSVSVGQTIDGVFSNSDKVECPNDTNIVCVDDYLQ